MKGWDDEMRKLGKTFLAAVLALTLLCTAVSASGYGTPDGPFSAEQLGDYLPALSTYKVIGDVMVDSYKVILSRFTDFSKAYGCHVYLWQWETLESSGYASFDDAVAEISQYAAADTVCVVYIHNLKQAYVQVGSGLVPEADVDSLADTLLRDGEEEPFFRVASFYNALCKMVGREKGTYVTGSYLAAKQIDQEGLEEIMVPLHEAFPGYIWVEYYSGDCEPGTEYSVLRNSREIDYDATYALWEHELEYYFKDAIYLSYYSQTGTAFLDFGENTGVVLPDERILELEAAFGPSTDSDAAGFRAGVENLAAVLAEMDLHSGRSEGSGMLIPVLVIFGVVMFVALAALLLRKIKAKTTS